MGFKTVVDGKQTGKNLSTLYVFGLIKRAHAPEGITFYGKYY